MQEEQVEEAALLLRQRDLFMRALDGDFVKKVETKEDWYAGSGNWTMQKHMVAATKECREVCEALLRSRAVTTLEAINTRLRDLGVTGDNDCAP